MSINDSMDTSYRTGTSTVDQHDHASTETKPSAKTTEFLVFLSAVTAVIVTAFMVDQDSTGMDPFGAQDALRYITYLTIGYMVARGLAKSGSRYTDNH